jgi:hypothetical protein
MTLAALTIFSPLEEDAAHDLQFLARLLAFCGVARWTEAAHATTLESKILFLHMWLLS